LKFGNTVESIACPKYRENSRERALKTLIVYGMNEQHTGCSGLIRQSPQTLPHLKKDIF